MKKKTLPLMSNRKLSKKSVLKIVDRFFSNRDDANKPYLFM
jgi:hypothetical protein